MLPEITKGNSHLDVRGRLFFNNDFDATAIKRIYLIENKDINVVRAWSGHRIQQRWFSAIKGSFEIRLIAVNDWEKPSKKSAQIKFMLYSGNLDVLNIPAGYLISIRSLEEDSKLLVMANALLGEIDDEYRFKSDYFE